VITCDGDEIWAYDGEITKIKNKDAPYVGKYSSPIPL